MRRSPLQLTLSQVTTSVISGHLGYWAIGVFLLLVLYSIVLLHHKDLEQRTVHTHEQTA